MHVLSPKYSRFQLFFSPLAAGLTNRGPVRDSDPGAPLALAVVSAVDAATRLASVPSRLLIFSDNTNTVNMFHSLRCLPPYNSLLKFTVSILIKYGISLRVLYVPGVDNSIADSLSRFDNAKAIGLCPHMSISNFQPPRLAMGQEL